LSLGFIIIILDTTILNVSLRTIINDLHTNIQSIQWVITAYSLMLAAFTVTGGRLGDIFGRKKMFMLGAVIFAIGSFIASISPTVGMLIVGEAIIEGIGAALMMPATMSLIGLQSINGLGAKTIGMC
jgi:MFS family permease